MKWKKTLKREVLFERTPKKRFALVDESILTDNRLSWRAKGLLIYILSKAESEERITFTSLLEASADHQETLMEALQELVEAGYALPDILKRLKEIHLQGRPRRKDL